MSSRCKCCDKVLKSTEIIWNAELKEHEEFCGKCRSEYYDNDDTLDSISDDTYLADLINSEEYL